MKEKELRKAHLCSILGFSIIAFEGIMQFYSEFKFHPYLLLVIGTGICLFALIKTIKILIKNK